jgi:hypothetical protein
VELSPSLTHLLSSRLGLLLMLIRTNLRLLTIVQILPSSEVSLIVAALNFSLKIYLSQIFSYVYYFLIAGVLALIFLALLIMLLLIGRYMSRHKGEYLTQEDKGADQALDPDEAIIHAATGHQVSQKKEFYI